MNINVWVKWTQPKLSFPPLLFWHFPSQNSDPSDCVCLVKCDSWLHFKYHLVKVRHKIYRIMALDIKRDANSALLSDSHVCLVEWNIWLHLGTKRMWLSWGNYQGQLGKVRHKICLDRLRKWLVTLPWVIVVCVTLHSNSEHQPLLGLLLSECCLKMTPMAPHCRYIKTFNHWHQKVPSVSGFATRLRQNDTFWVACHQNGMLIQSAAQNWYSFIYF